MSFMNRRDLLKAGLALGFTGLLDGHAYSWSDDQKTSDKLNLAFIGVGGRGDGNLNGLRSENVYALCDIDGRNLEGAAKNFPKAKLYRDFRKLLETEKNIDAVVVSTPDHTHAPASVMAMRMGKHVYCEKPLTHSIYEARIMREVAKQNKLITSMGNQGTASPGFRTAVEVLQSKAIGDVTEIHVWTNRPDRYWKQGFDRPKDSPPCPEHVEWDLWLGPAPHRPYHSMYHPFAWRGWCDFGTGALGDMACHTANLACMACRLTQPQKVTAETAPFNGESYPIWSRITYQFPARGDLPPVQLIWYDGMKDGKRHLPPQELVPGFKLADSGSLFIGTKGKLFSPDDYGASFKLLPEADFKDFQLPSPILARSPGHHKEWLQGIRENKQPLANFEYASQLTEFVLLGNVAVRLQKEVEWDANAMKVTNHPEAATLIQRAYRSGWSL